MTDKTIETRQVPQHLDNKTLQRMMDEHMSYVNAHNGSGPDIDLSLYIISDFDFSSLILSGMHAYKTTFYRCRFVGTDLFGASFDETVAPSSNFQGAILAKSVFNEADFSGANFDDANLIRVSFTNCDLRRATFRNTDFSGGWVSECNMEGAIYDPEKVQII